MVAPSLSATARLAHQFPMRPMVLVAIFLMLPMVPLAHGDDALSIGIPGAGALAEYAMTYRAPDRIIASWNVTDTWSSLETTRDGYGTDRPSYTVAREDGCHGHYPCAPTTYRVDPSSRLVFELDGLGGLILSLGGTRIGPVASERYFDFTYDTHLFATFPLLEWLGQGATFRPHDTLHIDIPRSPMYPGTSGNATLSSMGWEAVEGERLFRIEGHVSTGRGEWHETLWYDGVHPVPLRTSEDRSFTVCRDGGCEHHIRESIGRLVSYHPGGAPLVAPSTPWSDLRDDVKQTMLGPDGPHDLDLVSFPRSEAVKLVRAHDGAPEWFAAHPDAYLVGGYGREDTEFSQEVEWRLTWAEGTNVLHSTVSRPYALGVAAVVGHVVSLREDNVTVPYPLFQDLPAHKVACVEQAVRDLSERLGETGPLRPDRTVSWRLDPHAPTSSSCGVVEAAPLKTPAVEDHPSGGAAFTERRQVLMASVEGFSGGLRGHAQGHTGSVDAIWVDGFLLPFETP